MGTGVMTLQEMAGRARAASIAMAAMDRDAKDGALEAVAAALEVHREQIVAANRADLARSESEGLAPVLLKRLKFDEAKLAEAIDGVRALRRLDDPCGKVLSARELDEGLVLKQITVPIGVLGIVFESRPDALVQISALAMKSGNAALLKGGSEASETNRVLARVIYGAGVEAGLPEGWLGLLETREDVNAMLAMDDTIDLIIPRGSNAFVKHIMDHTRIAVLGHADGICHTYIHSEAEPGMALEIAIDAKCQYPAVCNATETLLVDATAASEFLPMFAHACAERAVELRGCDRTRAIIDCSPASEADWSTEYNDLILSVRVVDGLDEAIAHINRYGSGHTDAIVTEDEAAVREFMRRVDSADVFWNCSTRFADGFRYGLGAEVGISTNKIHARGPVGLEGLVIYKWQLVGNGHVVSDYADGTRAFTHKPLKAE
jgi:glutamate-5-semialdehyde dehydrogenase